MSELWTVGIRFRGGHQMTLTYGGEAAAQNAFAKLVPEDGPRITDHYGTTIVVDYDNEKVEAFFLEDTVRAHEAGVERALVQAHAQAKANIKVQADPTLRFSQLANGGQLPPGFSR